MSYFVTNRRIQTRISLTLHTNSNCVDDLIDSWVILYGYFYIVIGIHITNLLLFSKMIFVKSIFKKNSHNFINNDYYRTN